MTSAANVAPQRLNDDRVRRLGHIPALDGLRGLAVVLVILDHIQTVVVPSKVTVDAGPLRGAFLSVDMFFVLSGFLITALVLREQVDRGRVRFGGFYKRRAKRLLPALCFLLAAHVLYTAITGLSLSTEWLSVRGALLYVSNWTWKWDGFKSAPGLGHLWTLSIEEQFYLVWPGLMILFLGIKRRTGFVVTVMTLAILAVVVHRAMMWHDGTNWFFLYLRTDTRADSLLVGALLGQIWVRGYQPRRGIIAGAWIATGITAVAMVFARSEHAFPYYGGFTLVAVCTAVVIFAAADGRWTGRRALEFGPLQLAGRVSYGLYLWHLPVFYAVVRYGAGWNPFERVVVGLLLSAGFTALSWNFVERPISRMRDRRRVTPPETDPRAAVPVQTRVADA